jgi:hypothetical protein
MNDQAQKQTFSLSSKMLLERSKVIRKSLIDFAIFINNKKIKCNKAFCCCLFETVFQAVCNDTSLRDFHFSNIENEKILNSLLEILHGETFQVDKYSSKEIVEYFSLVGCHFEVSFNFNDYNDINWFLSLPFSHIQTNLYNKCVQYVSLNFEKIPITILQNLSVQFLELVLNNNETNISKQPFLFQILSQNANKYFLLKYVNLCEVDIQLLKSFLENLKENELLFDLLEVIKQLILSQINLIQQILEKNPF